MNFAIISAIIEKGREHGLSESAILDFVQAASAAAEKASNRTPRQDRNARYYEKKKGERPKGREWNPLTKMVYDRDGFVCAYCGEEDGRFCVDHIVPLSRGGTNDLDNLAVACVPCNSSKGFKLLSEWKGRYQ